MCAKIQNNKIQSKIQSVFNKRKTINCSFLYKIQSKTNQERTSLRNSPTMYGITLKNNKEDLVIERNGGFVDKVRKRVCGDYKKVVPSRRQNAKYFENYFMNTKLMEGRQ